MREFESTSQIFPLVDVGTYWGRYEFERMWYDYIEQDREEGYIVCDDYDFDEFKKALCESVQRVFDKEKPLEKYGVKAFHADKIGSPREYNFMDDWLEFRVEVDDDWFDKSAEILRKPENKALVDKYIHDHWHSCDGFTSFMPYDLDELLENAFGLRDHPEDWQFSREEDRTVGGILCLLVHVDGRMENEDGDEECDKSGSFDPFKLLRDELSDLVYEDFTGCHTHSDFMTTVDREEVDKVFKKHYLKFDSVMDGIAGDYKKYREAMAGNESSLRKAERWFEAVSREIDDYKRRQDEIISAYFDRFAPKDEVKKLIKKDEIVEELHDLRKEFDKDREFKWQGFWKEK